MDSGFKALLIMGNPEDRRGVIQALAARGASRLRVAGCGSLDDALAILRREKTDVVLLGTDLTDCRVLAALRRLREAAQAVPVIVLGSWPGADLEAQVLEEGGADYIPRSGWTPDVLLRVLVHAIERRRLQDEAERAVRAAKTAEAAVDDLVGTLGHELLSPLTAIRGALSNLQLDAGREMRRDAGHYARLLETECARACVLAQKLLDLARVRSGMEQLDLRPGDLRAAAEDAAEECAAEAGARNIALKVEWPAVLSPVRADDCLMRRVFVNLIENALRVTPAGGSVVVRATDRGGALRFTVTDAGRGVDPEERERIFARFYRCAGDRQRAAGAGLGLAICKEIVELHGGRIWVEDRGRKELPGSVFAFSLPAADRRERVKA